MTQLSILTASEQKIFDQPPVLNNDERHVYFSITPDIRPTLSRIHSPVNKVGFMLQLGYFRANARFYSAKTFHRRDISFVKRLLKLDALDMSQYVDTVPLRHRQRIQSLLNWRAVDADARVELMSHAKRYVTNQEYPKKILHGLVDLCWKRQWVIPTYHILNSMITDCFNVADQEIVHEVEQTLTTRQIEHLELLLAPMEDKQSTGSLTQLKRIDQSLKPSDIKQSMKVLVVFRDHYRSLEQSVDVLPLSDKATEYYATWLELADRQQLSQFTSRFKTYLHLLAFIKHQFYKRQDQAIDVLLKSVSSVVNQAKKSVKQQHQTRKQEHDLAVQELRQVQLTATQFANGVVAISRSTVATINEKYYKIEAMVDDYLSQIDESKMARIDTLAAEIESDTKNSFYYETLTTLSAKLQRRVSDIVRTVTFDAKTSNASLISAIHHFKATSGRVGARPPSQFLTEEEYDTIFRDDDINTPLYKALLFIHMAKGIKSGSLNIRHSYRYRSIEDYLINPEEWVANRASILKETDLAEFADAKKVLATLKERLNESYRTTNEAFMAGANNYMSVNDAGKCRVRTPKTEFDTHSFISSTLSRQGIIPILQLLKGVDSACQFTRAFKHFSTKRSKMKPSPETLMAGVIAQGCNIGVNKLAKISKGIEADTLRNTVNWYFDSENLKAANRKITSLIAELALANNYLNQPPSLHSSSDGRKVTVAVDCLHANYSFKYFGKEKGVTDYTFIDERQALFHNTVFSASDREAPYVIDGLLDNQVPDGHVHSTDTHGFTEQIFGTTHLMGVSFAPRLANLGGHRLYAFSSRKTYQRKGYSLLPSRTINQRLIVNQWENVLRFMATIKTRRATASQLFKRLSSYALDHPLYRALKEFGRIIKTQFILTYYDDTELRQRIELQLSRVELANKFSAAVFFDNDHAFQDGSLQQQDMAATCKLLLQNAIILWNYLSLSEHIINTPSPDEQRQTIEAIRKGSVITWSHVNMRGEYTFTPPSANDEVFDIRRIKAFKIS